MHEDLQLSGATGTRPSTVAESLDGSDAPDPGSVRWGSDIIADLLRQLSIPYVTLNPGASFRGLHDSIVNHLGNDQPEMLLCLHEEHAVAIAHGYAKITEQPLAVILHTNVGLMHASMAVFNAYCDRVPMLILAAAGPLDAEKRRPWIDWLHTAADQAAIVRGYVKWDDQPLSLPATVEALVRGHRTTLEYPRAPVVITVDADVQEAPAPPSCTLPDLKRHRPAARPQANSAYVAGTARALADADSPLIMIGRVSRSPEAWTNRVQLAERLHSRVLTDMRVACGFPTVHELCVPDPGIFLSDAGREALANADTILALDWVDLGGTLQQAGSSRLCEQYVISCALDEMLTNSWSRDSGKPAPVDLRIAGDPDEFVTQLLSELGVSGGGVARPRRQRLEPASQPAARPTGASDVLDIGALAAVLRTVTSGMKTCYVRLPLGWQGRDLKVDGPLDYLGLDGGSGIGSGPGMVVGAALALEGSERLPIGVLGDGDFLMGCTALWSAAHHRLPLLVVVANNGSYYNDEVHQEDVARRRARPVENRWVGQHIRDPRPQLAELARSLGLAGYGPVSDVRSLEDALEAALADARSGSAVVVDVHVEMTSYAPMPGARAAP